jgi:small subunit ribosomal protein S9
MEILARAVGRRKEAVAQVQIVRGTGLFIINDKTASDYLHENLCSLKSIQAPYFLVSSFGKNDANSTDSLIKKGETSTFLSIETLDTRVKVKGGGLVGQAEAIKLGIARALCDIGSLAPYSNVSDSLDHKLENNGVVAQQNEIRKQLKTKGFLTQDSRVKERRKYGLKKARKASQYHKR